MQALGCGLTRPGCLGLGVWLAVAVLHLGTAVSAPADTEWGGHLNLAGSASRPDSQSCYGRAGARTTFDGTLDLRLKATRHFTAGGYFEAHYEGVLSGGETRRKTFELFETNSALPATLLAGNAAANDDRRLFDLTWTVDEDPDYLFYQRLDRLSLTLQPEWGTVRLGRQALTWGNGFRFNPMDLFNPFAPSDIIRDYKLGDDMASVQLTLPTERDLQLLYVPRRDPRSGRVTRAAASLAGCLHGMLQRLEYDLMAARHYDDHIIGIGTSGTLAEAAWRLDATWTLADGVTRSDNYLSLVANLDTAWNWFGINCYGFVEFFHHGLGRSDYAAAVSDPDIQARLERGEMFTLGRNYLATDLHIEIHPLVRLAVGTLTNTDDPSGLLQPRLTWDMTSDLQVLAGAQLYYGGNGTEFGGFRWPGGTCRWQPADGLYLRLSWYF